MEKILVTGGAGYIGCHTTLALLENGFEPVIIDNFSNSDPEAIRRLSKIADKNVTFVKADLRDEAAVEAVFRDHDFEAAIHFAGLKAVGESVEQPLEY